MKSVHVRIVGALAAALSVSAARAAYVPVPLAPSSFNQDVVVEATAIDDPTAHYGGTVSASMDGCERMNICPHAEQRWYGTPKMANASVACPASVAQHGQWVRARRGRSSA